MIYAVDVNGQPTGGEAEIALFYVVVENGNARPDVSVSFVAAGGLGTYRVDFTPLKAGTVEVVAGVRGNKVDRITPTEGQPFAPDHKHGTKTIAVAVVSGPTAPANRVVRVVVPQGRAVTTDDTLRVLITTKDAYKNPTGSAEESKAHTLTIDNNDGYFRQYGTPGYVANLGQYVVREVQIPKVGTAYVRTFFYGQRRNDT
jgi:hypothetical protein